MCTFGSTVKNSQLTDFDHCICTCHKSSAIAGGFNPYFFFFKICIAVFWIKIFTICTRPGKHLWIELKKGLLLNPSVENIYRNLYRKICDAFFEIPSQIVQIKLRAVQNNRIFEYAIDGSNIRLVFSGSNKKCSFHKKMLNLYFLIVISHHHPHYHVAQLPIGMVSLCSFRCIKRYGIGYATCTW